MTANTHHSGDLPSARCAVITVSDTRTEKTDMSGRCIRDLLRRENHIVTTTEIIPDDVSRLAKRVQNLCDSGEVNVVVVTGGTGIAARDTTVEAIAPLLDKNLDGFGELFRMLSYEKIGAMAMLSRATAGIKKNTAIFALPGSTKAVQLAMEKLILPQLAHIAGLLAHD